MITIEPYVENEIFPFLVWMSEHGYNEFDTVSGRDSVKLAVVPDRELDDKYLDELDTPWFVEFINSKGESVFSYDRYFSTGSMTIDEENNTMFLRETSCQDMPCDFSLTLVGKVSKPSLADMYREWESQHKLTND